MGLTEMVEKELMRRSRLEGEREGMEKGMKKGIEKGIEKGKLEGASEEEERNISGLLLYGFSTEEIVKALGKPLELVQRIHDKLVSEGKMGNLNSSG